jgi:hypothetical protein
VTLHSAFIDDKTKQKLGEAGLAELTSSLWPDACQSCGRSLGDDPPAVAVDDLVAYAVASLHHPGCRTAGWDEGQPIRVARGDFVTWAANTLLIPFMHGEREEPQAALLVNPSMELVSLKPQGATYTVDPAAAIPGLVQPGPDLIIDRPVPGMTARITADSLAITIAVTRQTYEAGAHEDIVSTARARRGVLLIATHALDPAQLTMENLRWMLVTGRCAAGFAALHGAPRPAVAPKAAGEPVVTYVVTWNDRHIWAGPQVARFPPSWSTRKAQARAARITGHQRLQWRQIDAANPGRGFRALAPLSVSQYMLRRDNAGWQLVQAVVTRDGTSGIETDNEAKAWAAEVLEFKTGISGLVWEPGPAAEGWSSLQAVR